MKSRKKSQKRSRKESQIRKAPARPAPISPTKAEIVQSYATGMIVIAVCLLIAAPFVIVSGWRDLRGLYLLQPSNYSTVQGQITSTNFRECGTKIRDYCLDVTYSYVVDGVKYNSDRLAYSWIKKDRESIQPYVQKYPVGQKVTVYYETGNPSYAVLTPFEDRGYPVQIMVCMIGIAMLMFIISAYIEDYVKTKLMRD